MPAAVSHDRNPHPATVGHDKDGALQVPARFRQREFEQRQDGDVCAASGVVVEWCWSGEGDGCVGGANEAFEVGVSKGV